MFCDYGVSENCINHWTYGEICVGCGCCERNPDYGSRVINTIRYYKDCLNEEMNFDQWEENERWRKIQEENVHKNILYYKRKIRMFKKIFRTLKKSYRTTGEEVLAVDAVPVAHGKWIPQDETFARFMCSNCNSINCSYDKVTKVIGNIFDNPELLKGGA